MAQGYLIALGSNQRHPVHGSPRGVLAAAFAALDRQGVNLLGASPVMDSAPVGPTLRRYANAAALIETRLDPDDLLDHLHTIEEQFGRRRMGQAWRSRVLDLDIALWSGGAYAVSGLTIPHIHLRHRTFVLGPGMSLAPDWRDPITGLTLRHLHSRLTRPRPLP
ncbi:2-amino-4-hydroxy-6-hydroxymethyldihydropteridine diphosphokinase [Novosphingobium sp.]|uniref:2-amino-4-hydroxy-6- hydroxymethyldihydropteridine diphosphokinase n=1 Tax=Novosphingobium sp. TaxID=1874826 RepID=UPI00286DD911|nr:2-amino-4-hydroxy-6-hydroxymethyldihydropteridine diphosphokinase [Novosphingobium sp.]